MRVITKIVAIASGFMFTIILWMISESYKKQGGGYLVHISCFAHYGNTLMKINSRNGQLARPARFAPCS